MNRKVVILLTPFQLRQLAVVARQYKWNLQDAEFYSFELLTQKAIQSELGLTEIQHATIPDEKISLPDLLKSPLKEIPRHRQIIKRLRAIVVERVKPDQISTLIIGSDKDLFTQLIFNRLIKGKAVVQAIDEGSGYYKEASRRDRFFKRVYPIFSPLFFGEKLRYIATLGKHPIVNEVYARFPDHIPNKSREVNYQRIEVETTGSSKEPEKDLLIFTSPLHEDHHCSAEEESRILSTIIDQIPFDWTVDLKAHPREKLTKYERFTDDRIAFLDASKTAETIDYQNYRMIMHFGSSVILDLYQRGFDLRRVITLDMNYSTNKLTQFLFKKGYHTLIFSPSLEGQLKTFFRNG